MFIDALWRQTPTQRAGRTTRRRPFEGGYDKRTPQFNSAYGAAYGASSGARRRVSPPLCKTISKRLFEKSKLPIVVVIVIDSSRRIECEDDDESHPGLFKQPHEARLPGPAEVASLVYAPVVDIIRVGAVLGEFNRRRGCRGTWLRHVFRGQGDRFYWLVLILCFQRSNLLWGRCRSEEDTS